MEQIKHDAPKPKKRVNKAKKGKTEAKATGKSKEQDAKQTLRLSKLRDPRVRALLKRQQQLFTWLTCILLCIIVLLIVTIVLVSLVMLRHRQLCSYQNTITSGRLLNSNTEPLCRNPLDSGEWGAMLKDLFRNDFKLSLSLPPTANGQRLLGPDSCLDQLNPVCWLAQLQGELMQTEGFTNLLIVGSDSHWENVSGNTDTIMVASYDHHSGETILLSFPRDLLINHTDLQGRYVTNRINTLYPIYQAHNQSGRDSLNNAISQIIGKPIHYYVYFKFESFLDTIDALGGVTINLDEPFFDAFPCTEVPQDRTCEPLTEYDLPGYGGFRFAAGAQYFDSFDAMVYARSRQLSNDFQRARRQQDLVQAIIKNALAKELPITQKFALYTNIFNRLSSQVDTNIQFKDISGMFKLIEAFSGNFTKVVVDPELGGPDNYIVYSAGIDPVYFYIIKFHDYSYTQFQQLISRIWDYLPYYNEQPRIRVSYTETSPHLSDPEVQKLLRGDLPYVQLDQVKSLTTAKGIRIYDFTKGNKPSSLKDLQTRLPGALLFSAELEGIKKSPFNEDILIVIGQ